MPTMDGDDSGMQEKVCGLHCAPCLLPPSFFYISLPQPSWSKELYASAPFDQDAADIKQEIWSILVRDYEVPI